MSSYPGCLGCKSQKLTLEYIDTKILLEVSKCQVFSFVRNSYKARDGDGDGSK